MKDSFGEREKQECSLLFHLPQSDFERGKIREKKEKGRGVEEESVKEKKEN